MSVFHWLYNFRQSGQAKGTKLLLLSDPLRSYKRSGVGDIIAKVESVVGVTEGAAEVVNDV